MKFTSFVSTLAVFACLASNADAVNLASDAHADTTNES